MPEINTINRLLTTTLILSGLAAPVVARHTAFADGPTGTPTPTVGGENAPPAGGENLPISSPEELIAQREATINAGLQAEGASQDKINRVWQREEELKQDLQEIESDDYISMMVGYMTIGNYRVPVEIRVKRSFWGSLPIPNQPSQLPNDLG